MLAAPARAAHFEYVSTTYQMRKGLDDTAADVITPQNSISNPVCAQIGAQVAVKLVTDPGDPVVNGWVWSSAILTSAIDQTVFWTETSTSQTLIPVGTPVIFGNFPGFLDICHFTLHAAVSVGPLGSQKRTFAMVTQPNIYLTLGAPTAPMAVPWATILADADTWAHKASDPTLVSDQITSGLWGRGIYAPLPGFTVTDSDSSERFYARKFQADNYNGECNDFADYLVCASNAVGALPLMAQRDATELQIKGGGDKFTTFTFVPPHDTSQFYTFWYHQFAISVSVWDSVVNVINSGTSFYEFVQVVQSFEPGGLGMWTWPAPFLPTALAQ